MSMDLKEALEVVETQRQQAEAEIDASPHYAAGWRRIEEALGVVLVAARQSRAAELVAETNALTAKALEMARAEERAALTDPGRHEFLSDGWHTGCSRCRQPREAHAT